MYFGNFQRRTTRAEDGESVHVSEMGRRVWRPLTPLSAPLCTHAKQGSNENPGLSRAPNLALQGAPF